MSDTHQCSCCMTRRQCIKFIGAAALAAGMAGEALRSYAEDGPAPGEHIDSAGLRPKPEVRVSAAILRLPTPYWLGWPGTTYDVEKYRKEYTEQFDRSAKKLGIRGDVEAKPIQDDAGVTALIERMKAEKPHGLVLILQHLDTWGRVDRIAREAGVPVIVFSPIGTSFTGHVIEISRRKGVYVASSMDWAGVEAGMRMVRAKRMFEESRILWIQGGARNETVLDVLGTRVLAIPRATFNQEFDKTPVTQEVRDVASDQRRHAKRIVEPTVQDSQNSARAYVTAKRLMASEQATGLSMDCLGMVGAKLVPTPPCGAWTRLQDEGITAGCEADLFGATSLMMTSYLLNRPGYMNDPVAETVHNNLVASHCTSGTRIRGFDKPAAPYILRNHSESALGVSMQVLWPVGEPVTLVRFTGPGEMIIDTGTVVRNIETPPAGGCRTSVELCMDDIEDCRDVLGFHQVVTLGNHKRELESFCQLYGIKHVHSPRYSAA